MRLLLVFMRNNSVYKKMSDKDLNDSGTSEFIERISDVGHVWEVTIEERQIIVLRWKMKINTAL